MADTNTLHHIHINHLINIKLNDTNNLLWRNQFKHLLKGYKLEDYVDGSIQKPSLTLPNSEDPNPAFAKFEEHDQILLGWLLSSLSESVLGRVTGLSSSYDVWVAFEKRYAPHTRAHQMNLRRQLHNLRKGNSTMHEFFSKAKQLFDALAASWNPISEDDMQHAILSGLDQAYDSIVTAQSTTIATDMDTFLSHLLTYGSLHFHSYEPWVLTL